MPEPKLVLPAMDAITNWQGIAIPNPAARLALADLQALIADLAKLRGEMDFEAKPASFEAALQACKDAGIP